ncbi:fatty acid desaturase [Arenibaculum sp.]|jgi:hypothetical protein|uniref:fatty acid desaturase n=1 Tax=Arenibaculum sp. TaxID=2865862 RepID=UPI002E120102|nr:fatty acid desaturase [Arenibaculum sp.]
MDRPSTSPAATFAHTATAVAYVVVCQLALRLVLLPFAPVAHLSRLGGLDAAARRFPATALALTVPPVTWVAASGWASPFGPDPSAILLGTVVWLFLLHLLGVAYTAAAQTPTDPRAYEAAVAGRWPDRWYARHLRTPANAIYVRTLVVNTIVRIPAVAALIWPGHVGLYAVAFFVIVDLRSGMAHEVLDHADIHNNLFSRRHLRPGFPKLVLWLTGGYLRLVLNLAYLRVPHFYRVQHVYVHHVENNGTLDTQTTLLRDRTSFFDFCKHALAYALSWSFALDVYRHQKRRNNARECRLLVTGFAAWLLVLALVATVNPGAAGFFLLYRFLGGPGSAMESYFQHGLVDAADPDNVYTNTVNWVVHDPSTPAAGDFLHVRHHLRSGEHFSRQLQMSQEDERAWAGRGVLALGHGIDSSLLLQALLSRRFDLISRYVVPLDGARPGEAELCDLIERRTRPVAAVPHGRFYRAADAYAARLFLKYLLPADAPPPAPAGPEAPR